MPPSSTSSDAAGTLEETAASSSGDGGTTPELKFDVDVTNVSTCQRRVKVTVPREEIERSFDEALGELMPNALLPGFRPGRAPRTLVTSRFRSELKDQIRSKLLTEAMERAGEKAKLAPISEPDIDLGAVVLPDEGPMTFEFSIEVRPEFDLPKWQGLSIERPSREISDTDVNEAIREILRERGRLVPSSEAPAPGDLVVAALRFSHGDELVSEAEDVEIIVRPKLSFADAELAGFDKLVAKAKPGTKVAAEVTVLPDAAREDLRGKKLAAEITVVEVKRFQPPELSAALLGELGGFDSAEAFRAAVGKQLEGRLEWHRRRQVRRQVADALTASASWELPPELLRRQAQRELERSILELRRSGFDDDTIRRHVNQLRQNVMGSTARALKEHFILEKIAEENAITDDAADYDEEIRAIAAQAGDSPRRVRSSLEKRGLMDVLRNQIIERKTVDLITSKARFKDVPFEFERPDADAIDHAVCGRVVGEEEIPTATRSEAMDLRSVARR